MNEIYEKYKQEHPEELIELNRIKAFSGHVETQREKLRRRKQKRIEECRRELYGDRSE